MLLDQL